MVTGFMIPIIIALVIAAGAVGWYLADRRRKNKGARRYVANSDYLFSLPSFKKRLTMRRIAGLVVAGLVALSALATAFLAGRPVDRYLVDEVMTSRDIVLCLDVSGSMFTYDAQVLETYAAMVPSFQGERIGLTIWNSAARQIFPLTDDYDMVEEELDTAASLFNYDFSSLSDTDFEMFEIWMNGTQPAAAPGASLIGDGLASCVLNFDLTDTERSRAIILATDNQPNGESIFTFEEAAQFAQENNVVVHAIYASEFPFAGEEEEYQEVIEATGGYFYKLDDSTTSDRIVEEITSQQAVDLDADPTVVEIDRPDRFYPFVVVGAGLLVLVAWRLRV